MDASMFADELRAQAWAVVGWVGAGAAAGVLILGVFLGIRAGLRALANLVLDRDDRAYAASAEGQSDADWDHNYSAALAGGASDDEAGGHADRLRDLQGRVDDGYTDVDPLDFEL